MLPPSWGVAHTSTVAKLVAKGRLTPRPDNPLHLPSLDEAQVRALAAVRATEAA